METSITIYTAITDTELVLPFVPGGISAGFPSPALDFIDLGIDLNKIIIKHPASTFYGKVSGGSMKNDGIADGDMLVIDRSLKPDNGKIAVCYIHGEFTVKKIKLENGTCWLMPSNEKYKPIKVSTDEEFIVWGIVTHVIKLF